MQRSVYGWRKGEEDVTEQSSGIIERNNFRGDK